MQFPLTKKWRNGHLFSARVNSSRHFARSLEAAFADIFICGYMMHVIVSSGE